MKRLLKLKDMTIYKDGQYNCFPNIIRNGEGRLIVAFRQAPDRSLLFPGKHTHVDAASKAVYVTSDDEGQTWTPEPTVLYEDFCLGVQDPCLNVLKDGTLIATFFTWQVLLKEDVDVLNPRRYEAIIGDRWVRRLCWACSMRSTDGGATWEEPVRITDPGRGLPSRNIRGNLVELDKGELVLPLYIREAGSSVAIAAISRDRGKSWEPYSTIASSPERYFHEPNLYRTDSGKLVAFLRSTDLRPVPDDRKHPLFVCESFDNGATWSTPREYAIYSHSPFHLLRLNSGRVLLTYGHRIAPYGIRAYLLDSECSDLDTAEEIVLRSDAPGTDIGYTSSVQLRNGDILIVYYYYDELDRKRYIAGTLCREPGGGTDVGCAHENGGSR